MRTIAAVFVVTLTTSNFCLSVGIVQAVTPGDKLVPESTKAFVAIPHIDVLGEAWERTKLGELFDDPVMQPFIEDLEAQLEDRVSRTSLRIGIDIDDLTEVCAGEACIAFITPQEGTQKHSVAAIADVTDRSEEVSALLAKIAESMAKRDATSTVKQVLGSDVTVYTVPVKRGAKMTFNLAIFVYQDQLFAVDHEEVAMQLLRRAAGAESSPSLSDTEAYEVVMQRCGQVAGDAQPHVRWFMEPLGYAELAREAVAAKRRRRTDMIKSLTNQGFDAVRGMGGWVTLAMGNYEILYHGFVYAPPVPAAGDERYLHAARIMAFPGDQELEAQDWVPHDVSTYATATWKLQEAYQYIGSLIDEIAGEPGFFEDLKKSLLEDPNGPQINLDKEIVAYLGDRVTIFTDTIVPITPKSERFVFAIELTDAEAMAQSLAKALRTDPDAQKIEIDGHIIWEILNQEEDIPVIEIEGGGEFDSFVGFEEEFGEEEEEGGLLLNNAAISVVKGQLMISSHVDLVVEIIRRKAGAKSLKDEPDFQRMRQTLQRLGSLPSDTGFLFSRFDQEMEASYELIRQGRMPESEGLFGTILNRILGPEEKGVLRKQEIDGEKMPEYDVVRKYLGPVGGFLQTEDQGWQVSGVALAKQPGLVQGNVEPQTDQAPLTASRSAAEGESVE